MGNEDGVQDQALRGDLVRRTAFHFTNTKLHRYTFESVSEPQPSHSDRRRAQSFGAVAMAYDAHRPRYPEQLISFLMEPFDGAVRALDVGAGTGIAAIQLRDAGAEVLAVEPDPRMANVASGKGLVVEQATFESWEPRGRRFDLVVFGQSFHWVRPRPALRKIAAILNSGGRLALLSNRVTPISPSREFLDRIYDDFLPHRTSIDAVHDADLLPVLADSGFVVERKEAIEDRHYATEDWLDMVFTHSSVLTLESAARVELRYRLEQFIGSTGVDARNDATALIATPRS